MILIYLIIYGFLIAIIVLFGGLLHRRHVKSWGKCISLNDITVIIPFRNESRHLAKLLKCINDSDALPRKIVLINDHSEDDGLEIIDSFEANFACEVYSLDKNSFGKKEALRLGFSKVNTPFILTLDADVYFESSYFRELEKLSEADLWILPVIQQSDPSWNIIFEMDLHVLNAINVGLTAWYRPIIASGANLLFSLSAFQKVDNYHSHKNIASGDDIFMLRDFINGKQDIKLANSKSQAVYTNTCQSWKEFMHQRIRWIAKTTKVNDALSTLLAILQSVFSLAFYGLLTYYLSIEEFDHALTLFIGKCCIDFLGYAPYFFRFNKWNAWILFPIYNLIFPFYNIFLLVLIPFFNPMWKGRSVKI